MKTGPRPGTGVVPTPLHEALSRRSFLRAAGAAAGLAALAPLLEACATAGGPKGTFEGDPTGLVNFANWPLYIDKERAADGHIVRPSLELFQQETGIQVNYREVIPDAQTFYERVQKWLAAGEPTGWDIMVITNGQTLTEMIQLNYLVELPGDRRPNFDANAADSVKDPAYDPGNRFTMAWQSGITGIAYNPQLTGREIDSLQDLFDPAFEGRVGMFGDNVDLPNLAILAAGAEPETSTPEDWRAAAELLRGQREGGIVRDYYTQSYVNALANGEVALTMAWSGDIFQQNASGQASGLQFVVPGDGALLWTDAMCIPRGAQHPVDAIELMDFVYRPEVAAMIAEWVNYITPVPGARDSILDDAGKASGEEAVTLENVANSPLVFPSEQDQARLHTYRVLADEGEVAQWNATFGEFYV